tara:strand:+ start:828 stop:1343 length:516 start_codon:yes stop_codon:yes gene_type:complete
MGLKQDLIDAKVKAVEESGLNIELDTKNGSMIEREAEYTKEAIANFLTQCEFRITQLNAPVILENFKIPEQVGDVLDSVISEIPAGAITTIGSPSTQTTQAPVNAKISSGEKGVQTHAIDISKDNGGLRSNGYVHIGQDPDSQDAFDVEDEDGQREFTTVKLIREDIEDLL